MIKLIQLNFLFLFPSAIVPEVARHTGNQLPTGATSLKILVAQGKFYMPRATGHPLVSNPEDRNFLESGWIVAEKIFSLISLQQD